MHWPCLAVYSAVLRVFFNHSHHREKTERKQKLCLIKRRTFNHHKYDYEFNNHWDDGGM